MSERVDMKRVEKDFESVREIVLSEPEKPPEDGPPDLLPEFCMYRDEESQAHWS